MIETAIGCLQLKYMGKCPILININQFVFFALVGKSLKEASFPANADVGLLTNIRR